MNTKINNIYYTGGLINNCELKIPENVESDCTVREYIQDIITDISNIMKTDYETRRGTYNNFKDMVNSKYFKDRIIGCIRKSFTKDEYNTFINTYCNNQNIYNYISDVMNIPTHIIQITNWIKLITGLLACICVLLVLIFSVIVNK